MPITPRRPAWPPSCREQPAPRSRCRCCPEQAIAEPTETVVITLTNALNGTLAAPAVTLSIDDDDPLTISTSGVSISEGNAPSTVSIDVTLNRASELPVSIG